MGSNSSRGSGRCRPAATFRSSCGPSRIWTRPSAAGSSRRSPVSCPRTPAARARSSRSFSGCCLRLPRRQRRLMAREPVLIVDDNPQNLKLAKVILAAEGYEVKTAIDAEDALRILESFRPRLILMDLQLPRMDGLELTRRLKADPARREIIIIALTAYAMKGDDEKAFAAGCDGYISKPIDIDALPRIVAEHLAPRLNPGAGP